jgi:hypothetical protein
MSPRVRRIWQLDNPLPERALWGLDSPPARARICASPVFAVRAIPPVFGDDNSTHSVFKLVSAQATSDVKTHVNVVAPGLFAEAREDIAVLRAMCSITGELRMELSD